MSSAHIAGTFAASYAISTIGALTSQILMIPSGVTQAKLYLTGLDINNKVRMQKSTDNGVTWVNQTLYNSDQSGTVLTVAHGEHWRASVPDMEAGKSMAYKLSVES